MFQILHGAFLTYYLFIRNSHLGVLCLYLLILTVLAYGELRKLSQHLLKQRSRILIIAYFGDLSKSVVTLNKITWWICKFLVYYCKTETSPIRFFSTLLPQ